MSTLRYGASPSDKARKLVAELVEVSDKYHNGTHAKSWQIWAVNEIANALAAAPSLHKEGLPECGCEENRCFGPITGYRCRAGNSAAEPYSTCGECTFDPELPNEPAALRKEGVARVEVCGLCGGFLEGNVCPSCEATVAHKEGAGGIDNEISITIRGQEQVAIVMEALHKAGFVAAQAAGRPAEKEPEPK